MNDILVGRQPIYGRSLEVVAYELLFRGQWLGLAGAAEGDRATSQVILNAVTDIGLDRVVGEHDAFLNVTRSFIVGDHPLPVPSDRVVLEILEDIQVDDEVLAGLQALRARGFRIALDDFVLNAETRAFVELADIVKIDILEASEDEVRRQVELLRSYDVELLAEKIETYDACEICRELGFDYFQGFFLAKPRTIQGRSVSPSHLNLLKLLAELQRPDFDFEHASDVVSVDVGLSYRLLRHMNSALYGMPRPVESIHEALVYLGAHKVRNMIALLALAAAGDKPQDLLSRSMQRAKMCELMARRSDAGDAEQYFTAGLFSTLDALLDLPMADVLGRLPLSGDLHEALLVRKGPIGNALTAAVGFECGDLEATRFAPLPPDGVQECFLEALDWVRAMQADLRSMAA